MPEKILAQIFEDSGKSKSPIPICGTINGKKYSQTLMRYKGEWRLYINTTMLKNSPKRIGETVDMIIQFDAADRTIKPHPEFSKALGKNKEAKKVFDALPASRQKEINRYISSLKTKESRAKNIERAIGFLKGKERFVGRDKP